MIDHTNLPVSDLGKSAAFYAAALDAIGLKIIARDDECVGFGLETWIFGVIREVTDFPPIHIAFVAPSRPHVREFYEAAVNAGGCDNGKPGPRPMYGPHYYSAYVLDPDGHNVEIVCRTPTQTKE